MPGNSTANQILLYVVIIENKQGQMGCPNSRIWSELQFDFKQEILGFKQLVVVVVFVGRGGRVSQSKFFKLCTKTLRCNAMFVAPQRAHFQNLNLKICLISHLESPDGLNFYSCLFKQCILRLYISAGNLFWKKMLGLPRSAYKVPKGTNR